MIEPRRGNEVMKTRMTVLALVVSLCAWIAMAQDPPPQGAEPRPGPPPQAYEDCRGKNAGDTVQHMTREGKVAATCVDSPQGLVARPNQPPDAQSDTRPPPRGQQPRDNTKQYSIEQAVSDQAQLHTIAFSGLAFITGDFGACHLHAAGQGVRLLRLPVHARH